MNECQLLCGFVPVENVDEATATRRAKYHILVYDLLHQKEGRYLRVSTSTYIGTYYDVLPR